MTDAIPQLQDQTSNRPLIELLDVSKTYPGIQGTVALKSVSFQIASGDFISITGPSGSGKSSLLNVLGLLDSKNDGTYRVRGNSVDGLSAAQLDTLRLHTFGFVFQASHAISGRTVAKNVELPLTIIGTPQRDREQMATNALRHVGILHKANDDVALLSGGERQRMAIARALVHRPDILLLDEPTGNLDSDNTTQIIALLHRLHAAGITIIVVTHDHDLAAAATRMLVLRDGSLTETTIGSGSKPKINHVPVAAAHRVQPEIRPRRQVVDTVLDAISDALYGITDKPLRTIMLLLVVMLGAGGLVAAQGISQSAANQVSGLLSAAALDEIYATASGPTPASRQFSPADEAAALSLDGVLRGGIMIDLGNGDASVARFGPLAPGAIRFSGFLSGSDVGALRAAETTFDSAAALPLLNSPIADRVALIGAHAAKELGISNSGPGEKVWVSGKPFEVAGIITASLRKPRLLDSVVLSNTAITNRLGIHKPSALFLVTEAGMSHNVGTALPLAIDAGNPARVKVQTLADIGNIRAGVNTQLNGLVFIMALVLLGLAVLATAAVMTSTVLTRRSEIGLRRAIGTSRTRIGTLFMLEGLTIGAAGGLAGAAAGVVIALIACLSQGWTPALSPASAILGIITGISVGALSTIVPAIQATRIQPALALRG